MKLALLALLLLFPAHLLAQDEAQALDGNREMAEMFAADQSARQGPVGNWEEVSRADAERRRRTRALLDAGELQTATDFYAAAFIFQHGGEPEDYLLAHALAVRSLALGKKEAEWIAAATLDRYLHAIARDQIYGTQYRSYPGQATTQGRYDRKLLTDQLRNGAGVETLEAQDAKLKQLNHSPE